MVTEVWKLPVPSTALLGAGVALEKRPGREIALRYEFEGPADDTRTEAIVFEGVESFKCTYGGACGEWMLSAYDRLVEVTDSSWAKEVAAQLCKMGEVQPPLRHLMIHFDDGPCYEAICRGVRIEKWPLRDTMALEKIIGSIESEWEPETGFFWKIRQGEFRKNEFDRAFAKFAAVSGASEELLPVRLVSVLWYVPIFMEWQIDRVRERGGDLPAYKTAMRRLSAEVERILGLP